MKKTLMATAMLAAMSSQALAEPFFYVWSSNCAHLGESILPEGDEEWSTNLLIPDSGSAWYEIEYHEGRCHGTFRWHDRNMRGGVAQCELGDGVEEQTLLFVEMADTIRMREVTSGEFIDLQACK